MLKQSKYNCTCITITTKGKPLVLIHLLHDQLITELLILKKYYHCLISDI